MALSQTFKLAFSNVPVLTKTLVTTLLVLSCTSYIYTYRASISTDDPDTTVFVGCPFIGILPGTYVYPLVYSEMTIYVYPCLQSAVSSMDVPDSRILRKQYIFGTLSSWAITATTTIYLCETLKKMIFLLAGV